MADQLLKLNITDESKQGVKTARKEIEEILASREGKK